MNWFNESAYVTICMPADSKPTYNISPRGTNAEEASEQLNGRQTLHLQYSVSTTHILQDGIPTERLCCKPCLEWKGSQIHLESASHGQVSAYKIPI